MQQQCTTTALKNAKKSDLNKKKSDLNPKNQIFFDFFIKNHDFFQPCLTTAERNVSELLNKGCNWWIHSWFAFPKDVYSLFMESQSYGASPAIWDHTVLPATRHRWARPTLTPAMQAGTRFTYAGGMEGWVYLVTWKRSRHESNSRPLGSESNTLTTEPPSNIFLMRNDAREQWQRWWC